MSNPSNLSPPSKVSIDGFKRSAETERQLNSLFATHAAGSAAFREILAYLRSITIQNVGGPHITNDELRHREGGRFLMGLIEQRIEMGKKHNEPS